MKHFIKTSAFALALIAAAVATALAVASAALAQSSPNLGITHIQQNQSQKEVTANQATDALDIALTDFLAVDFTGGDVTLTNTEFRENILFRATNLGADQALTVPALKRLFVVENPDGSDTVTVTRGGSTESWAMGERLEIVAPANLQSMDGLAITVSGTTPAP